MFDNVSKRSTKGRQRKRRAAGHVQRAHAQDSVTPAPPQPVAPLRIFKDGTAPFHVACVPEAR